MTDKKQKNPDAADRWHSGTPRLLVFTPHASKSLLKHIGWLREDYPENRKEQGGLLVGRYIRDANGNPFQAEVTAILPAQADCRLPGYIEWSAMEEIRLQQQFFQMQDTLAKTNPQEAEELSLLGWWHTHPNGLPVFMSETDMETQRLKYDKPEKYSVVLNPHRGIWRAFSGKNAVEVPSIMLLDGGKQESAASAPDRKAKHRRKKSRKNKLKSKRKK